MRNIKINQSVLDIIADKFSYVTIDPYLLKNHKQIAQLFYQTYTNITLRDLPNLQEHFETEKTLTLNLKFFNYLNKDYGLKFINDLRNKKIIQDHRAAYTKGNVNYAIRYYNNKNLNDATSLAHEYTHHLSFDFKEGRKPTSAYRVYKEALSILGELKFLDFLKEENLSQETELYKQYLKNRHLNYLEEFMAIEPLFNIFIQMERLDKNKINYLANFHPFYCSLKKEALEKYLMSLQRTDYDFDLSYQHAFGMITAAQIHHLNNSNENFTNLMEKINKVEVKEFERLLPKTDENSLKKAITAEFTYQKTK